MLKLAGNLQAPDSHQCSSLSNCYRQISCREQHSRELGPLPCCKRSRLQPCRGQSAGLQAVVAATALTIQGEQSRTAT